MLNKTNSHCSALLKEQTNIENECHHKNSCTIHYDISNFPEECIMRGNTSDPGGPFLTVYAMCEGKKGISFLNL